MPSDLTWAGLLLMLSTSVAACGTTGETCNTDELPPSDPCYMKGCCESVPTSTSTEPGAPMRLCGACNG